MKREEQVNYSVWQMPIYLMKKINKGYMRGITISNRQVKDLKKAKNKEIRGKAFQAEGTAVKKALKEDYTQEIQRKARRPEWLKRVSKRGKQQEMKFKKPGIIQVTVREMGSYWGVVRKKKKKT